MHTPVLRFSLGNQQATISEDIEDLPTWKKMMGQTFRGVPFLLAERCGEQGDFGPTPTFTLSHAS